MLKAKCIPALVQNGYKFKISKENGDVLICSVEGHGPPFLWIKKEDALQLGQWLVDNYGEEQ